MLQESLSKPNKWIKKDRIYKSGKQGTTDAASKALHIWKYFTHYEKT